MLNWTSSRPDPTTRVDAEPPQPVAAFSVGSLMDHPGVRRSLGLDTPPADPPAAPEPDYSAIGAFDAAVEALFAAAEAKRKRSAGRPGRDGRAVAPSGPGMALPRRAARFDRRALLETEPT